MFWRSKTSKPGRTIVAAAAAMVVVATTLYSSVAQAHADPFSATGVVPALKASFCSQMLAFNANLKSGVQYDINDYVDSGTMDVCYYTYQVPTEDPNYDYWLAIADIQTRSSSTVGASEAVSAIWNLSITSTSSARDGVYFSTPSQKLTGGEVKIPITLGANFKGATLESAFEIRVGGWSVVISRSASNSQQASWKGEGLAKIGQIDLSYLQKVPKNERPTFTFSMQYPNGSYTRSNSCQTLMAGSLCWYANSPKTVNNSVTHLDGVMDTVSFNSEGGSVVSPTAVYAHTAVGGLSTPSKPCFTFAGWYTAASGGSKIASTTIINSKVTYYAHWTAAKCSVTFNSEGGSSIGSKSIAYNTAVGTLTSPTRSHYTFAGWYTAASGGTKIATTTKVTTNVTYYAHWTPVNYSVTFNSEGGSAIAKKTVAYNTAVGSLPTPTKAHCTFAGWYTAASGGTKITTATKITGNVTYYAHWTPVNQTVTFNSEGGSTVKQKIVPYNTAVGALTTPTKAHCTFAGWYTAASGGTKVTSTTKITGNVTYYAHWTKK